MEKLIVGSVLAIRSFYLLTSAAIVFIYAFPPFKSRFLAYGARSEATSNNVSGSIGQKSVSNKKDDARRQDAASRGMVEGALDAVAAITVPHSWFMHFYVLLLACNVFWAVQILSQGRILHIVLEYTEPANEAQQVSALQVGVAWVALCLQGIRRLVECIDANTLLTKSTKSPSRMFFGHWIMGLAFYFTTSIAIWIEGDRSFIAHTRDSDTGDALWVLLLVQPNLSFGKQITLILGITLFFAGSIIQGTAHAYLSALRAKGTYSFPQQPLFKYTLTPHYAAECLEYLGLALIVSPRNQIVGKTMLCCVVFVAVNLGVTAEGTREWYKRRFGEGMVGRRARMVPGVW